MVFDGIYQPLAVQERHISQERTKEQQHPQSHSCCSGLCANTDEGESPSCLTSLVRDAEIPERCWCEAEPGEGSAVGTRDSLVPGQTAQPRLAQLDSVTQPWDLAAKSQVNKDFAGEVPAGPALCLQFFWPYGVQLSSPMQTFISPMLICILACA